MELYKPLAISLEEFKKDYWLNNSIKIPREFMRNNENLNEEQFFALAMRNIYDTCDLAINQCMSYFLAKSKTLKELTEQIGEERVKNFKSACYYELYYRLANENFPEFVNKQYLSTNAFNINNDLRDFSNFSKLLNDVSLKLLAYPVWDFQSDYNGLSYGYAINQNSSSIKNINDELLKNKNSMFGLQVAQKALANKYDRVVNDINSLNVEISNLKGVDGTTKQKLEQLVLSLAANAQNDAETLKKFNALSKEYADKYEQNLNRINTLDQQLDQQTNNLWQELDGYQEAIQQNGENIGIIQSTYFNKDVEEKLTKSFNLANNTRIEFNANSSNDRTEMYYFETFAENQNFNLIKRNSKGYFKLLGFDDVNLVDCVVKKYIDDKFKELEAKINNQHAEVSKDDVRKMIADELNKKNYVEYKTFNAYQEKDLGKYRATLYSNDLFGLNTKNNLGLIYDMYGKYIRTHNEDEYLAEINMKYIPFEIKHETFDEDE